ncbi:MULTISPECIES: hypothetical protein [Cyanophyceae]|uniref:Uncharacterized protein n=1 Tax=Leptolyngbya subtilissima DQ-A4 TaxID=2933933 RepID=A0ABV0KA72_9CYAN|nr:hypothetical protein [Nodosilinea sp. FACHB-141]MBD2115174.1 hypothetical protein [Nodosilinea sp. FACHB-141]
MKNLEKNLPGIQGAAELVLVVPVSEVSPERREQIGFSNTPQIGQRVLPAALGPISRLNAEGSFIRHRDQPKETCYRQREWQYTELHGKDKVEATKIVDVPYQQYPRTLIPPPGVELIVTALPDGVLAFATESIVPLKLDNPDELRHAINLMLELFRFCDVLGKNLLPAGVVPVTSLNWQILPPGRMPWATLQPHIQPVIDRQKPGNRPVVAHRLALIHSYSPEFAAVGHGGFSGYVIFGFPARDIYICECAFYENATYVFRSRWEELSRLTKAEILNDNRHLARFIHRPNWKGLIRTLFKEAQAA